MIPALQSRCTKFKFVSIPIEDSYWKLKQICENEGLGLTDEVLKELLRICKGDLRKSINTLQSIYLSENYQIVKDNNEF